MGSIITFLFLLGLWTYSLLAGRLDLPHINLIESTNVLEEFFKVGVIVTILMAVCYFSDKCKEMTEK